jgi:hypothetical protein
LTEPYRTLPGIVGARPFVAVRLQAGDIFVDTWALIDSGTDRTLFHHDWLAVFSLSRQPSAVETTLGIGGTASIRSFEVELFVCGVRILAPIGFTGGVPREFGLLGRAEFFNAFLVGFDNPQKQVHLEQLG